MKFSFQGLRMFILDKIITTHESKKIRLRSAKVKNTKLIGTTSASHITQYSISHSIFDITVRSSGRKYKPSYIRASAKGGGGYMEEVKFIVDWLVDLLS